VQLDAVKDLVGPGTGDREREIDALLVDGGINDLNFSDIITKCATNDNFRRGHTDCVTGLAASKLVNKPEFAARYDKLAKLRPSAGCRCARPTSTATPPRCSTAAAVGSSASRP
jgi:hypothetical protein